MDHTGNTTEHIWSLFNWFQGIRFDGVYLSVVVEPPTRYIHKEIWAHQAQGPQRYESVWKADNCRHAIMLKLQKRKMNS